MASRNHPIYNYDGGKRDTDDEDDDDRSENTEAWIQRALDEEYISDEEAGLGSGDGDRRHDLHTKRAYFLTRLGSRSSRSSSTSQNAEVVHAVQALRICNSGGPHNGGVEVQQVWEEADSDDDDDVTITTARSDSLGDSFSLRVGQPLVHLQQQAQQPRKLGCGRSSCSSSSPTELFTTSTKLRLEIGTNGKKPRTLARPYDLLEVEAGQAAVIVCKPPGKARSIQVAKGRKAFLSNTSNNMMVVTKSPTLTSEVGVLGGAWRSVLRIVLLVTMDLENRLRVGRFLQSSLPFLTAFECCLLGQVIEALDSGTNMKSVLTKAMRNRNVSRLLVQAVGPRHDFLFHWSTAVSWNRPFDMLGQFPVIGAITRFPATENFPTTRNHALSSIFRVVLGQGNWWTRVLTGGREGLITDDPNNTAQNLTAESNGFELANRNQYGTHFGRTATNQFRLTHRLPTDESLLRTFAAQPMPTMTNNGVIHTLRQLAKHWTNMLAQEYGNFAHQRMEQLDPFDTLRFHLPQVLLTLASLRGRNVWDAKVLGPMIAKLQALRPDTTADKARRLVYRLSREIVGPVSGGIATVVEPFQTWLGAISVSLDRIEMEVKLVYELVSPVELGIRLGYDILEQVSWKVPSDKALTLAILAHTRGKEQGDSDSIITSRRIENALERTTPRDKRTLIDLIKKRLTGTKPAKLLLARVKTLLQREIRRDVMNEAIHCLSKGDFVKGDMIVDYWYWLEDKRTSQLYVYRGETVDGRAHKFLHVDSGSIKYVTSESDEDLRPRAYIPVAEAITRAQKAFMTIELTHGKVFKYNAFMEFAPIRVALRRLVVVSQMACEALDNARLNVLGEIQRLSQAENQVAVEPQNVIVIGGGPAGMMTCLHCTESCLTSGGVVKLYEARDSFAKGGSTYERAQIVRLDARWIAMLRYHLGTGFEDVYIPASGETDSQLGNTLPSQGFVEITIKDLENMLHVEISRHWSRGVLTVFTDARSQYDPESNSLTKLGENLKVGDVVLRRQNNNEERLSTDCHRWKVTELVYTKLLGINSLKVGEEYGVYYRPEQVVLPFTLTQVELKTKTYVFKSAVPDIDDLRVSKHNLPSVYPIGTHMKAHADVHKVVIEREERGKDNRVRRVELLMENIKKMKFTLDVGNTHVVEAIGKPNNTQTHLQVTTPEPYGVCCMEGLKISMGMHNFGEKRWGSGIVDDVRSLNDQNTRIIGDFTKMVRTAPIVQLMHKIISTDNDWIQHFQALVAKSQFPVLNALDPVVPKLESALEWLAQNSTKFRRQTLQTRFFEVGDNFYLGMEMPREYDQWKQNLAFQLVVVMSSRSNLNEKQRAVCEDMKQSFAHSIDRLWFFACLETIRTGDVYNPGARRRVPKLYLINSTTACYLDRLPVGESFRRAESPEEKYEILAEKSSHIVARNVEGYVFRMEKSAYVLRESNLTRNPDGNVESKVAIATFPVSHYVNHRTMRVSDDDKGYVFAFTGDEQASPHFMRYSGLTGACINAMSFNVFLQKANEGVPFLERFRNYAKETNWSNGEVVQRGTGANFGEDGFLRPGFSYDDCMDYLYSKAIEFQESGQPLSRMMTRDWKAKFAACFVPRGMELNSDFTAVLLFRWQDAVFAKLLREIRKNEELRGSRLEAVFHARKAAMGPMKACFDDYWHNFIHGLRVDSRVLDILTNDYELVASTLYRICREIIDFAAQSRLYNERISSELCNQPKPVDSVVDDFAVEAQSFANSLTLAAAFGAGALALRLFDLQLADRFSAILGALNILIAFSTMTNVARYKIRNEEARVVFLDERLLVVKMATFSLMQKEQREYVPAELNPLLLNLEKSVRLFQRNAAYYEYGEPTEFNEALVDLMRNASSIKALRLFQKLVVRKLIGETYHVNSYVQESLVEVYKTVDEIVFALRRPRGDDSVSTEAEYLLKRLTLFEGLLERTLQRGPVRWGFIKTRKFLHWDVMIAIRYFYSLFWFFPSCGCRLAPIETETASLLLLMRRIAKTDGNQQRLRREVRDVETLYQATLESDIASLIFLAATLTFFTSIVFTVARIFTIRYLTDLAFYSAAASSLGAILAVFHLFRKFCILSKLWKVLGSKSNEIADKHMDALKLVRRVTFTQIVLTLVRFCTAAAAATALVFSVAEIGYTDKIPTPKDLPFWIAMGAITAAIGSTIFFFVVEYVIRYRLSTDLGPFVCNMFRSEIDGIHKEFSLPPSNSVDTKLNREREAWEYTARDFLHRYRFDTVFAADRFAQLLQYIQSAEMKNAT